MSTENTQVVEKKTNKFTEATVNSVLARIAEIQATGEIVLPRDYVPENAVRAAWLMLPGVVDRSGNPALEVCTKESVCNAFLDMVTSGLSISKKQGYFVVYGNKLQFDQSYIGDITIAKRVADVKEVNAVTVYKDDEFEYSVDFSTGRKKVTLHNQKLANIGNDKIVGAYAIVTYNDGSSDSEIMTIDQIKTCWTMGGARGNSPAHNKFPDQMCEKTVIARSLKIETSSSSDKGLLSDKAAIDVQHEIKTNANKETLDFSKVEEAIEVEAEIVVPEVLRELVPEMENAPGF
ncbi:MAG: recombinase RecT [Methylotenera sp.]|nr:recombinase RecT [Flavobacterium sp.]